MWITEIRERLADILSKVRGVYAYHTAYHTPDTQSEELNELRASVCRLLDFVKGEESIQVNSLVKECRSSREEVNDVYRIVENYRVILEILGDKMRELTLQLREEKLKNERQHSNQG